MRTTGWPPSSTTATQFPHARGLYLLRRDHNVPLQQLRELGAWLHQHYDEPWSRLRFYVADRTIFFEYPGESVRRAAQHPTQTVFPFEMEQVAAATERDVERLRERSSGEIGRVVRHRYVSHNQPVIAGTRIRTEAIWNFHRAGFSVQEILAQYPRLTEADIDAALAFERSHRVRLVS